MRLDGSCSSSGTGVQQHPPAIPPSHDDVQLGVVVEVTHEKIPVLLLAEAWKSQGGGESAVSIAQVHGKRSVQKCVPGDDVGVAITVKVGHSDRISTLVPLPVGDRDQGRIVAAIHAKEDPAIFQDHVDLLIVVEIGK